MKRVSDSSAAGKALAAAGKAKGCCGRQLRVPHHADGGKNVTTSSAPAPPVAPQPEAKLDAVSGSEKSHETAPEESGVKGVVVSVTPDVSATPVESQAATEIVRHVTGIVEDAAINFEHALELGIVHFFEPVFA